LVLWERSGKSMVKLGDMVKVIDNQWCYDSYEGWVTKNAPNYLKRWARNRLPKKGNTYEIITIADHGHGDGPVYGVFNNSDGYFVVSVTAFE
jgi:hypothetical protein